MRKSLARVAHRIRSATQRYLLTQRLRGPGRQRAGLFRRRGRRGKAGTTVTKKVDTVTHVSATNEYNKSRTKEERPGAQVVGRKGKKS